MTGNVKAVLDIHEPTKLQECLQANPEVEDVKLAMLPSADISIGGVGFERKTWSDYVNSMKSGRLEEQAAKMASYEEAYVLVEGDMSGSQGLTHSGMSDASIRGHMASLTAREEYPVRAVLPCSNMALLADTAVRLARKHTEEPSSEYLPTGTVGVDEPEGKQMWGCLPGVGPELANRLWNGIGSPMYLAGHAKDIRLDTLKAVDGVGIETARKIDEAMWGVP